LYCAVSLATGYFIAENPCRNKNFLTFSPSLRCETYGCLAVGHLPARFLVTTMTSADFSVHAFASRDLPW